MIRTCIACVVWFATSMAAQPAGAPSDLISGVWTGDMAPPSAPKAQPIKVEMKLDGTAVSGLITGPPLPGEIKTGTFDPKSGVLKLEVEVKGDGGVTRVVFEGMAVRGVATGRVTGNNVNGGFQIVKAGARPAGGDAVAAARRSFQEVSGWIAKAADLVPADKYTYRPATSVRTFGQLIAHMVDSYNYYCARGAGRNVQWADTVEKSNTDKATLVPKLNQALGACEAAYNEGRDVGELINNVGHASLHYGNAVTYMRMLGLTPPSN